MRGRFSAYLLIFAIAWGLSDNKKAFPWKIVIGAVVIQFAFALILFGIPIIREASVCSEYRRRQL